MFDLPWGHNFFGTFLLKNRESKREGRTERYGIEKDHQLELELPSILSGKDKLQGECILLPITIENECIGCRPLIEQVIT